MKLIYSWKWKGTFKSALGYGRGEKPQHRFHVTFQSIFSRFPPLLIKASKKSSDDKKVSAKQVPIADIEVNGGVLMVAIIESKNLAIKSSTERPYCMVDFDKNEIVVSASSSNSSSQIWKQKVHL